jgi:patatin-like phospholipase/acyl hydrolase
MKYILSLDGGGIRGIIPAMVLAQIEKNSQKSISELFDMIVGTSTGGILAMALSRHENKIPKYSAKELINIYKEDGNKIFNRSLWKGVSSVDGLIDERYSHKGLEEVLNHYLHDKSFEDLLNKVVITSYDITNREPVFFKNYKDSHKSLKITDIARATSAAPTYFEPIQMKVDSKNRTLIDGGIFINNPSVSAYVEAKKLFPNDDIKVISIGTGELVREISYEDAKDWGKLGWMLPSMSCMFDGMSDASDYQMKQLLGDNYIRLQTKLEYGSDDMDNASKGNIKLLMQEAEDLIADNQNKLLEIFS